MVGVSDPRSGVVGDRSPVVAAEVVRRIAAWAQLGVSPAVIAHELRLNPQQVCGALAGLSGGTAPRGEGLVGSPALAAGGCRVAGESLAADATAAVATTITTTTRSARTDHAGPAECRRPGCGTGAGEWSAP